MDWTKATIKQLKTIIQSDFECPKHLLYGAFEEVIKRDGYKHYINSALINRFGTLTDAEQQTKMTRDELKWHLYERVFQIIEKYKQGHPILALWNKDIQFTLRDLARTHRAQMRTADVIELDKDEVWMLPVAHHNTEKTALDRVYIDYLFSRMTDSEKKLIIMKSEGYEWKEMSQKLGMSIGGLQKRLAKCVKRMNEEMEGA